MQREQLLRRTDRLIEREKETGGTAATHNSLQAKHANRDMNMNLSVCLGYFGSAVFVKGKTKLTAMELTNTHLCSRATLKYVFNLNLS